MCCLLVYTGVPAGSGSACAYVFMPRVARGSGGGHGFSD